MATLTSYAVKTDVGTFTRKTARTYTHIVLGRQLEPGMEGQQNWGVFGWCGRLDLARATVRTWTSRLQGRRPEFKIIDVITGQEVR